MLIIGTAREIDILRFIQSADGSGCTRAEIESCIADPAESSRFLTEIAPLAKQWSDRHVLSHQTSLYDEQAIAKHDPRYWFWLVVGGGIFIGADVLWTIISKL